MNGKLQSLTQEEIKQRELSFGDLWILKMGEEIKGPYELEALKSYIQENESEFEDTLVSKMEPQHWSPLFSLPQFQRRTPQVLSTPTETLGPFWLYENGLKTGPFEKFHILKRLEMNSLIVTDKLSLDNGKTWINVYEIPEFDRRDFTTGELPSAPLEGTLAELHTRQIKNEEREEELASEILASSAHHGFNKNKVLQFKTQNYSLPKASTSFWSQFSFPDWLMPSALALGVMIVGGVTFTLIPSEKESTLSVADIAEQSRPLGEKRTINPSAQLARSNRAPASVGGKVLPRRNQPALKQIQVQDNIPTTIKTHHVDRFPSNDHNDPDYGHYEEPYTDPYDNPFEDQDGIIVHEAPPAASLVPPRKRPEERRPSSMSEMMGYEENLMEEASDF